MTFKQFYLLKENPDYAIFNIDGEKIDTDYLEKNYTFIILDYAVFFTPEHYHRSLLSIVKEYLKLKAKSILKNASIIQFGQVREFFEQEFAKTFGDDEIITRIKMLNLFPQQLLGRLWIKNIKGVDYMLVTIWNDYKNYNLKNLDLIKWMAEYFDIKDSERIIFEINKDESKTLSEMISSVEGSSLKGQSTSADTSGNKPVHELPPEQKKQALIKMGAKPKTPLDFNLKRMLNQESTSREYS